MYKLRRDDIIAKQALLNRNNKAVEKDDKEHLGKRLEKEMQTTDFRYRWRRMKVAG